MTLRLLAVSALVLVPAGAQAQTPFAACVGGNAGGYACNQVDLMAHLSHSTWRTSPTSSIPSGAEIWGWTDSVTGHEYALVAVSNGTAFVDVTDPDTPVYVGRLPQPAGVSTSGWRTVRTYQDHLFVGSEASNHGIQVFDLTQLRTATPPQIFSAQARYTGNGNAHTLSINEDTGFLYIAGGNDANSANCDGGGLHIVNIQNPTAPVFAGCYDSDGYTHEAQCYIYQGPDTTHQGREICAAYNQSHVTFVDVTNKSAPALISRGFYPNTGYTHQGWFTEDWRYLLINDEFASPANGTRTIVMNVEDLDAPTFGFNYLGPMRTHAHNLYVRDNYAYLANYRGGLHIVNLDNIASSQLSEVAFFDTFPADAPTGTSGYDGMWMAYPYFASGTIVANDIDNGLFVLKATGIVTAGEPGPIPAAGFLMSAPVPNPTGSESVVTLTVAEAQHVRADAYDALGRRVAQVFDGAVSAGSATRLSFVAGSLPAGPYLLRVEGETFATTTRITVAR